VGQCHYFCASVCGAHSSALTRPIEGLVGPAPGFVLLSTRMGSGAVVCLAPNFVRSWGLNGQAVVTLLLHGLRR
jgi:hypothetical protein